MTQLTHPRAGEVIGERQIALQLLAQASKASASLARAEAVNSKTSLVVRQQD